ncbi:hypothetical protein ACSSS7_004176 [Eimeria intestinalis]
MQRIFGIASFPLALRAYGLGHQSGHNVLEIDWRCITTKQRGWSSSSSNSSRIPPPQQQQQQLLLVCGGG